MNTAAADAFGMLRRELSVHWAPRDTPTTAARSMPVASITASASAVNSRGT